jgi:hypothetical protein
MKPEAALPSDSGCFPAQCGCSHQECKPPDQNRMMKKQEEELIV